MSSCLTGGTDYWHWFRKPPYSKKIVSSDYSVNVILGRLGGPLQLQRKFTYYYPKGVVQSIDFTRVLLSQGVLKTKDINPLDVWIFRNGNLEEGRIVVLKLLLLKQSQGRLVSPVSVQPKNSSQVTSLKMFCDLSKSITLFSTSSYNPVHRHFSASPFSSLEKLVCLDIVSRRTVFDRE